MTHDKMQLAYLIGFFYSFNYFKRKGRFQKPYTYCIIITILFAIFEDLDILLLLLFCQQSCDPFKGNHETQASTFY